MQASRITNIQWTLISGPKVLMTNIDNVLRLLIVYKCSAKLSVRTGQ